MATALDQVGGDLNIHSASIPIYLSATLTADDTDNHDYIFSGNGKSVQTVHVYNGANQTLTTTLYGSQTSDGAVGSAGTVSIGSFTTAATTGGYECCSDPFPYYIIRLTYGSTPDGNSTYLYVNTGVD